jgi:hypothetical protein
MPEQKTLWRHQRVVSRSFSLRRGIAAVILTFTARSSWTVFMWIVLGGGIVAVWYAVHVVASAHNPTLNWTTGVSTAVVLVLLVFFPAARLGGRRAIRSGVSVIAVVNAEFYAYKIGERTRGVKRANVASIRRLFGVVALTGKSRSSWLIIPSHLFPTREDWRKLNGKVKSSEAAAAASNPADVPKWGG